MFLNSRVWIKLLLCCMWVLKFHTGCFANAITSIKLSTGSDKTRLVLSLEEKPQYHFFVLKNPLRYVIDVRSARLTQSRLPAVDDQATIRQLRVSQNAERVRMVLDMKGSSRYEHFVLGEKPSRLVLDLLPSEGDSNKTLVEHKVSQEKSRREHYVREVVVLIDAGHGGKDPGAIGPRGTHEKKVVLAIANKLKLHIDKQPGMRAVMTRGGDYYVPLRSRLQKARAADGDLFISIHADAFKNRRYYGSSVYALSARGASSEAARWLAEKENYSELSGVDLSDKSQLLRSVLIDLSQTATINDSIRFGEHVLSSLKAINKLRSQRVEQAPFVVLKSPDIPSLLVETGFISNRREELRLRSPQHQEKLAAAIFDGVKAYFRERPLKGTVFANTRVYQVKRGDSLSRLAHRFGVDMASLKETNGLLSNTLWVGQKLNIPLS